VDSHGAERIGRVGVWLAIDGCARKLRGGVGALVALPRWWMWTATGKPISLPPAKIAPIAREGNNGAVSRREMVPRFPVSSSATPIPKDSASFTSVDRRGVEIAAFDLLVVGQRPVVPTDKVHL